MSRDQHDPLEQVKGAAWIEGYEAAQRAHAAGIRQASDDAADSLFDEEDRRATFEALDNLPHPGAPKESNPKQAFGDRKAGASAIPQPVMYELGLALLEGALKYGKHNWRVEGVRMSTYYDACRRHLDAWWEGQDVDPASRLPHLVKAIACLVLLRDADILGKVTDDRPPRHEDGWLERYEEHVAWLREQYPDPPEPNTQSAMTEPEEG